MRFFKPHGLFSERAAPGAALPVPFRFVRHNLGRGADLPPWRESATNGNVALLRVRWMQKTGFSREGESRALRRVFQRLRLQRQQIVAGGAGLTRGGKDGAFILLQDA